MRFVPYLDCNKSPVSFVSRIICFCVLLCSSIQIVDMIMNDDLIACI